MAYYINGFGPNLGLRAPLSKKMVTDWRYLAKEERKALKEWVNSLVEEKGQRTTFVYDRKYINFMCENWGSIGVDWYHGADVDGYPTGIFDDRTGWFSPRPKGI